MTENKAGKNSDVEPPVRILYVEKSYKPAPTEVTYIPHSPVREYDYYAILELGGKDTEDRTSSLILPFLIEDLTALHEYGGKTAADKLLGVSMPVLFMITNDRKENGDNKEDNKKCHNVKDIEEKQRCRGSVCPSRSAWTFPVVLGLRFSEKLKNMLESFCSKTLYVPLVAKDFWDELIESQFVFAPSIYVEYVVEPLLVISKDRVPESGDRSQDNEDKEDGDKIYDLFWINLCLRTEAELCAHKGICRKICDLENNLSSLKDFYEEKESLATSTLEEIKNCDNIDVVLVIPSLKESVKLAEKLKLRLSPFVATLAAPILYIAHTIKSKESIHLNIMIYHDYGEESSEERSQIRRLKEYIEKFLKGYGLEKFIVDEIYVGKRFSKTSKEDIRKSFENRPGGKTSQRKCAILIVRDAEKRFLNNLLDVVSGDFDHVYYIYASETIPVYVEKACNLFGESSSRTDFPIASLLVYFSMCMGEDEKQSMKKLFPEANRCETKSQKKLFETCVDSRIVDNLVKISFIDVFRIK